MIYSISITSQGQINIPASLRQKLGLNRGGRAIVSEDNGRMIIEPVTDLLSLKGSLKSNKEPLSNTELHDFVAQASADDYGKKIK